MATNDPKLVDARSADGWEPRYLPSALESVLTPEMCERTISLAREIGFEPSMIYPGTGSGRIEDDRVSESVWIPPDRFPDLYRIIGDTLKETNDRFYRFSIYGMNAIQIIRYEPGSFFRSHCDIAGGDSARRKISLIVQLSDPDDYEGGDLAFFEQLSVPKARGFGCVFPSWCMHRVEKVTKGTRYSLAAWAKGKYFL